MVLWQISDDDDDDDDVSFNIFKSYRDDRRLIMIDCEMKRRTGISWSPPLYIGLITKTRLFKYIENFTSKTENFS